MEEPPELQLLEKTRKLVTILCSSPYRRALWQGAAAATEHGPLLRNLRCNTVVDVGANRGQFAMVARRCFPEADIFSFEPLSAGAQIFRRVLGNDSRVILRELAIGSTQGTCDMHVSKRDDSSSLLPIGTLHAKMFPGTAECRRQPIRVERLDAVLSPAHIRSSALLKVDVEGYEIEVLRGCGELLTLFAYAYVEVSFIQLNEGQPLAYEVVEYLEQRGFQLRGVFNVCYDNCGNSIQADFLFANANPMSAPARAPEIPGSDRPPQ